jgi:ketosteroid isomerase-like protein
MVCNFGFVSTIMLLMIAGCREQPIASPVGNKETALAMFEAFNKHDWQKMASYYVDGAEFLDPSLGKTYVKQSHQEIIEKYQGMQQMFHDIADDVTGIYADGESVVVQFTSHGNMSGGSSFSLPIVTVLTFSNGLIARDATYYDLENE